MMLLVPEDSDVRGPESQHTGDAESLQLSSIGAEANTESAAGKSSAPGSEASFHIQSEPGAVPVPHGYEPMSQASALA